MCTRKCLATHLVGLLVGGLVGVGCVSVKAPDEVNVGVGNRYERVDPDHVPATRNHEEARRELRRAYAEIRRLRDRNDELRERIDEVEEENERLEDRIDE
jgi:predicted RNase H-like nuclease (RuvC/YqgF family)